MSADYLSILPTDEACAFCGERSLNELKVLPCSHLYCLCCLSNLAQQTRSFQCHTCGQKVDIPKHEGVAIFESMDDHVCALSLRDQSMETASRKDCQKDKLHGPAVCFCEWCHLDLCMSCGDDHQTNHRTKNHSLEHQVNPNSGIPDLCKTHPNETLCLFCLKCEKPLCRECIQKHELHERWYLSELVPQSVKKLQQCLREIEDLEKVKSSLEEKQKAFEESVEINKEKIKTRAHEACDHIKNDANYLCVKLDQSQYSYRNTVSNLKEKIMMETAKLLSMKDVANKSLFSNSPAEVVTRAAEIRRQLNQIQGATRSSTLRFPEIIIVPTTALDWPEDLNTLGSLQIKSSSAAMPKCAPYRCFRVGGRPYSTASVSRSQIGCLIVCTDSGNLPIYTIDGTHYKDIIGNVGSGTGAFNIVEAPSGALYCSNMIDNRIYFKSSSSQPSWTEFAYGQFIEPRGLALCHDKEGNIHMIVSDIKRKCISKLTTFTSENSPCGLVEEIIYLGKLGIECGTPYFVAVNLDNDIIISDYTQHCVYILSRHGTHKRTLGSPGHPGSGPHLFHCPTGIAMDKKMNIAIADHDNDRIQLFSPSGQFKTTLLTQKDGIHHPWGIQFTFDDKLVVAQMSSMVISVFNYKA